MGISYQCYERGSSEVSNFCFPKAAGNIGIKRTLSNLHREGNGNTPVLLPGKSHGQRSFVGCSPWGIEESDMTERLHFHFSLSYIREGNDNQLQCSCLENPREGGAWWAAVCGVAQSQTRLKQLSSSSNSIVILLNLKIRIYRHCEFWLCDSQTYQIWWESNDYNKA